MVTDLIDFSSVQRSRSYEGQREMVHDTAQAVKAVVLNHGTNSWGVEVKFFEPPVRPQLGFEVTMEGWDATLPVPPQEEVFLLQIMTALADNLPRLFPRLPMEIERLVPPQHRAHGFVVHVAPEAQAQYPRLVTAKAVVRPVRRFGDNRDLEAIANVFKGISP
jgi:hypothetical protein